MNALKFTQFTTFFIMLISSLSAYSLDILEDKDVYWNVGRNVYFKFDKQDSKATGRNDHPVELSSKQIKTAMESIQIWEKDDLELAEETPPVFTEKQTSLLGQHLAKGLKKAKPDQDILFVLDKRADRLFGLKTDIFYVAGRAFYKDGKLNIIIGDYDRPRLEGYEKAYDPTEVGIVGYNFLHGRRTASDDQFKENTIKVSGIENKVVKKRVRKDWFMIDVETASEAYLAVKRAEDDPRTPSDKQFEIEAAKLAKERREMRLEMARLRKEMKEGGGSSSSALTAEQRLENLQQLKEKGLITDDEYAVKREEILNDL